jgi:acyl-CoA oxidase
MVDVLTTFDSALGVSDSRVYEALWKRVQMEPVNKDEVTPAYGVSLCS